jgi:hypothetical protein
MSRLVLVPLFLLAGIGAALAQPGPAPGNSVASFGGSIPAGTNNIGTVTVLPAPSVTPTICQGGTGSPVTSVGTTPTLVCAAGTARSYWRIANNAAAGGSYVYCTDDGSTPTLTHWTFVAYAQGYQDTTGMQVISPAALSCVASAATTIAALSVQTGAAP